MRDQTNGGYEVPPEFVPALHKLIEAGGSSISFDVSKPQSVEEVAELRGVTLIPQEQIDEETNAIRETFRILRERERRRKQIRSRAAIIVVVAVIVLGIMYWSL